MRTVRLRRWQTRIVLRHFAQLGRDRCIQRIRCKVSAGQYIVSMIRNLKSLCHIAAVIRDRCEREDVRRGPDTSPIRHGTAGCTITYVLIEPSRRAAVVMVIAGHNHRRLKSAWEIPETWQRLAIQVQEFDHVYQQSLLLIPLRNGNLRQIDPVGFGIKRSIPEEHVFRSYDRRVAIGTRCVVVGNSLDARPCRDCPGAYRRWSGPGRR